MNANVILTAFTVLFVTGAEGATTTVHAAPRALLAHVGDDGPLIAIAAKKKVPRYPNKLRARDRNLGPVPDTTDGNAFLEGFAGILGAGVGGGGSGTCAVDYTTPNPTGCRVSRYSGPSEAPAYRPQKTRSRTKPSSKAKGNATYTCFDGANRRYTSKSYKLGCYFADLDTPGHRPSDGLRSIK